MTNAKLNVASQGVLYVVATPIGNLEDLSSRAARILRSVTLVAAEDTRHTSRLLTHLGVNVSMLSLHDHNEKQRVDQLDDYLQAGQSIALVSDAGTPLISDPGYVVVRELRDRGRTIVPVPGASALIAALSAAGVATDRFTFAGFLPAKPKARLKALEDIKGREETLVFYESPHRIVHTLTAISEVLEDRPVVLARELTKTFETFLSGSAASLLADMQNDPNQARGEFVIMIEGAPESEPQTALAFSSDALLDALLNEGVGVKQGAAVAARLLGGRKQNWYAKLQAMKSDD
ncbi:16S rRNA (cytidine(1402)-2'-O)-methyltransferase [Vreelandella aquamarina]